jgi:hypothetical protein
MTRDSPPELARELAAPYASSSTTRRPALVNACAAHAPNTPAPITHTSKFRRDIITHSRRRPA